MKCEKLIKTAAVVALILFIAGAVIGTLAVPVVLSMFYSWYWLFLYAGYLLVILYVALYCMQQLAKDLNEEANRKYDFIIERTNAIVGEITDASGLSVGSKQDLNGFIVGTRGTAKVQTIGAGGYIIQCFHFRTLINAV